MKAASVASSNSTKRISASAREGNRLQIRWTATTGDIDACDGSEPDNRIEIDDRHTLEWRT